MRGEKKNPRKRTAVPPLTGPIAGCSRTSRGRCTTRSACLDVLMSRPFRATASQINVPGCTPCSAVACSRQVNVPPLVVRSAAAKRAVRVSESTTHAASGGKLPRTGCRENETSVSVPAGTSDGRTLSRMGSCMKVKLPGLVPVAPATCKRKETAPGTTVAGVRQASPPSGTGHA